MEVPPFNVESNHVMSQCQGCVDKKWLDLYYASLKTNISEYLLSSLLNIKFRYHKG